MSQSLLYLSEKVYFTVNTCKNCHINSRAFRVLTLREMEQFEKGCTQVPFQKGDKVIKEGIPVTNVIYLKSGLVKVCLKGLSGKDIILKVESPGSFIGLHDVFAGRVRSCSAIALTPVIACFISHEVFSMLIRANGAFALEVLKYISREEVDYLYSFISMQERHVHGRVAGIILYFADHIFYADRFTLDITQSELGTMIGASRESVSRVIKEFRKGGILKWQHQTIEILRKNLLKKISKAG